MLRRVLSCASRRTAMTRSEAIAAARHFVDDFNESYERVHEAFEVQFWGTKMALASSSEGGGTEYSAELLAKTKKEMEDVLSDPEVLREAEGHREALLGGGDGDGDGGEEEKSDPVDPDLIKTLDIIIRTCGCNSLPTETARSVRSQTSEIESSLEMKRNGMKLGYVDPDDADNFVPKSSVGLRNMLRTSRHEKLRRAAYDGLRTIGSFVCDNGFVEIVKMRNVLARELGYEDYYDYTVTKAEGFGKKRLFEILDGLEEGTRPLMEEGRRELVKRFGEDALLPWNQGYMMAGSVVRRMDPYFPFSKSVERYARSYSALGIKYDGAVMTLDLLDRPGKYSNGFCHWTRPSWVRPDGTRVSSHANFTSLADPSAVGSGLTALTTLMHEAGHAAHFACVAQPCPLFSQERAPTSVAYAENQSMFLDSLVGDAAWRARYALNGEGEPIPFDVVEEEIRSTQPFAVFALRSMLSVSYYEKALYELPDEEVTVERMIELADEVEAKIQGGPSPRPLLSVPHLVSDEASCYYQGYTLAEMSVHQTREYFKEKHGGIVDNPAVGPTLTEKYWRCGNSRPFLEIVRDLTGKELSGEAWTRALRESAEERIKRERVEYDDMLARVAKEREAEEKKEEEEIDLDMTVRFVDGDLVIAESGGDKTLLEACREFEQFVTERVAAAKK